MEGTKNLENRERDLNLRNREGAPQAPPAADEGKGASRKDVAAELAGMRDRIEAARLVEPPPERLHCRDCFEKGRDAAIRTIEGRK